MKYTIKEISDIAGVSKRTLRYYDEIDLLNPVSYTESNYRIYNESSLDILQQILIFKSLDIDLSTIRKIINASDFNIIDTLYSNYEAIGKKKERLDNIQQLIKTTITSYEREITMTNDERFSALKEQSITDNDDKYGDEIRNKYGDAIVEDSYTKMRKMTKYQIKQADDFAEAIKLKLKEIVDVYPVSSIEAMKLCEMHQKWITLYWPVYQKDAHMQLVEMYLEDERFSAYYEKIIKGATLYLRDAMKHYLLK